MLQMAATMTKTTHMNSGKNSLHSLTAMHMLLSILLIHEFRHV